MDEARLTPPSTLMVESKPCYCGVPLHTLTIRTHDPDKWLFVDTETHQVWRWNGETYKRAGTYVEGALDG